MILVEPISFEYKEEKCNVYIIFEDKNEVIFMCNGNKEAYCREIAALSKEFNECVYVDKRGQGIGYLDVLDILGVKVIGLISKVTSFKEVFIKE